MKLIVYTLFLFCTIANLSAEKVVGNIISLIDNCPVMYAHILYGGHAIGVLTDENGRFEIDTDVCMHADTLQISCVGYETQYICFSELLSNTTICLKPVTIQLDEVVVLGNHKSKIKKGIGMRIPGGSGELNSVIDSLRGFSELGTVFNLKKPFKIENVLFKITKSGQSDTYYRLNIYEIKNDSTLCLKNTVNEIVKIERNKKDFVYKFPIHITETLIGKVYVSFEIIRFSETEEDNKIIIPAYLGSSFVKRYIDQKFISHPISLGLKIEGKELQD